MSDEAARMVQRVIDSVGGVTHDDLKAGLAFYIERIERERDEARAALVTKIARMGEVSLGCAGGHNPPLRMCGPNQNTCPVCAANARIAELARERDEAWAENARLCVALRDMVASVEETFDTRRGELKHLKRLNAARKAIDAVRKP